MKYSDLFITGCDAKTAWMLPWFVENFRRWHPEADLLVYSFDGNDVAAGLNVHTQSIGLAHRGWYNKPFAIERAMKIASRVLWLDTDCEVKGDLRPVLEMIQPGKLSMVEDRPWTTRHKETWYNTGVVGVMGLGYDEIVREWVQQCALSSQSPNSGDQQILHSILRQGMNRLRFVSELPRKYNVLRLDVLDGTADPNPVVMHWTGQRGKDVIKEQLLSRA